jgi:BioD-like phosphotransacetylase family protein
LTITSGDRTDMILAALESNSVGIILTNNILPPPNIISKASERDIPLLLVSTDTYEVAKQIDNLQPLLTKDDTNKIDQLVQLVKEHVNISSLR